MSALTITATNVLIVSGTPKTGTLLGTVTAGMALYTDGTRGVFGPSVGAADANSATAAIRTIAGVSLSGGAVGQPCLYCDTNGDVISFGAILTANTAYIMGATTAGDINPVADITAGWYYNQLGVAVTTSQMKLAFVTTGVAS